MCLREPVRRSQSLCDGRWHFQDESAIQNQAAAAASAILLSRPSFLGFQDRVSLAEELPLPRLRRDQGKFPLPARLRRLDLISIDHGVLQKAYSIPVSRFILPIAAQCERLDNLQYTVGTGSSRFVLITKRK